MTRLTGWALAALACGAVAPAVAQDTPAAPPIVSAAEPAIDPARLAAARPVIDAVWPMGTYARIMGGAMDQMTSGMMANMYAMKPEEIAGAAAKGDEAGKTFGEIMAAQDPYYRQRTDITMHVMFDEMGKLMTEVEPEVRAGLVRSYARRFTTEQLGDLRRFFATPTGRTYAADSMLLMMGPDMMKAMQSFAPRMLKAMPGIMAKVAAATKDLPPPKAKANAK